MRGVDSFKINDVQQEMLINNYVSFFILAQQPPRGPRPPHYYGFTITLRHTTLDRTPLDE